jgi:hypothetical protein
MPRTSTSLEKPPKARAYIEDPIQAAIVSYVRLVAPQVLCFAVPNGGRRDVREAARMKWTGTLAGVHDLILIEEPGLAYLMEIKAPDGVLSEAQKAFHAECSRRKIPHGVAHSINEARDLMARWGIKSREAR